MTILLVVGAVLLGLAGLLELSQATLGVGLIALACLLAILARIEQATRQHYRAHPPARIDPSSTTEPRKIWERL